MAGRDKKDALTSTHAAENLQDPALADDQAVDLFSDLLVPDADTALDLPIVPRNRAGQKRGPGRPPGAKDKRQKDLIQYLMAHGYHSPMEACAAVYNMDTMALTRLIQDMRQDLIEEHRGRLEEAVERAQDDDQKRKLRQQIKNLDVPEFVDPQHVLALQMDIAKSQMPYWHPKQSPDVPDLPDMPRPLMVINQTTHHHHDQKTGLSAGIMPEEKTIEHQPLNESKSVRRSDEPSHE